MRIHARLPLALPVTACSLLFACLPACGDAPQKQRPPRQSDAISTENQLPGDAHWDLELPSDAHQVEGYADAIHAKPGDTIGVKVNVDHAKQVSWTLFRVGWYGGMGAREISSGGPLAVAPQPPCPHDPTTQRVECSWATAFSLKLAADAVSGVYLVKLVGDDKYESFVPFVVYDGRAADVVMNVNVTSWQAYNDWGGESLYEDASGKMPSGKAWEVSYDRPFAESHGAGRFLFWEVHMVHFLEALGYDVSYTTAFDITHDPQQVLSAKTFLSVANDEYWTVPERDAVQAARDAGVNLAFLGADQALWRVRLQPSTSGAAERVIACYKGNQDRDPVRAQMGDAYATSRFRDEPNPRPENGLIGVMYVSWMLMPQPLVVADASSWVFAGTGLKNGDSLPLMVAFEADARFDNGAEPAGLQVLARSPFVDAEETPAVSSMTYYQAPSGAEVIGVGSIGWPSGLGAPPYTNPLVARITRNILDRFVRDGRKGGPDPQGAPWTTSAAAPQVTGAWAKDVTTIAGAPSSGMGANGPGVSARFAGPSGIAVAPDGSVLVADAPAHQIRRIAPDAAHTVSTYAGDGTDGTDDGPGTSARFRWPTGLALGGDGTLYVADSDNHTIRAIAPDAAHTVSTYAGMPTRGGGFADGPGASALFDRPVAIAVTPSGTLLVADEHNCRIRAVDTDGAHTVSTYAGSFLGYADGPGAMASFNNPTGLALAPDGSLYVLDTYNAAIRRVAADGAHTVTTLVGGDGVPALVDGDGGSARIGSQAGLAFLGGKLYVSDVASERLRVITPGPDAASTTVATFVGSGRAALEDGGGASASIAAPMGLAAAKDGTLWLADSGNLAVRRITP